MGKGDPVDPEVPDQVVLYSEGYLTGSGTAATPGSASPRSGGGFYANGTASYPGSATIGSSGAVSATGSPRVYGQTAVAAIGNLTATGLPTGHGSAALGSAATLSPTGSASGHGAASLRSSGTITTANSSVVHGSANLTSSGSIVVGGLATASALISSLGSLAANGSVVVLGSANLGSQGAFGGLGQPPFLARSAGTLSANGTATAAGSAALGSMGSLAGSGPLFLQGSAFLASSGTLGASSAATLQGSAFLRSSGAILTSPPPVATAVAYRIYANTGIGDAIDYSHPIGTTSALAFATPALPPSSDWSFAVRAFGIGTGLEEDNVDARVRIILDSLGVDRTAIPSSPILLGAMSLANGTARVDWAWSLGRGDPATAFAVYLTAGSTPSFSTPAATINAVRGRTRYSAIVGGLSDGVAYVVSVRAVNAAGSDSNAASLPVVGSAVPPANVDGLTAVAVISPS